MSTDRPTLLRARGLGKSHAGVPALSGVDLDVRGGEVLAVVGENGAGKSTLLRILSGVTRPDDGSLELAGADGALRPAALRSVRDASAAGIAFVHQELNLAENLDVAGNIYLGREPSRAGFLDLAAMNRGARDWLARVGLGVDPSAPCGELPIAERQLVEIAKALSRDARILLLDEPTSSLSARETETLLGIVESLRARGTAVVFVSHHLDEVVRLADRVLVLRDGRTSGERARGDFDRAALERLMVGRDIAAPVPRAVPDRARVRLRLESLVSARRGARPVAIEVRAGEIVGLAGLVGAGRTELLESIAGISPHGGTALLDGRPLPPGAPARVACGVAIVPEDRARHGILAPDPVRTNVSLAWIGRQGAVVRPAAEDGLARRLAAQVRLRPEDPGRPVETLSGGNQQKTVLARWIAVAPAVLLLDEPTRGVDVGARADIHAEVRRLADSGTAVLFASSELEEVLALADRVLVMHEGAVVGDLPVQEAGEVAIMHLATGGTAATAPGNAA